jgi:ferredoxin-NADP reductase/MOSC domain-containing protein YiiM
MVRRFNIDGDGQGDLAGHGGEHRAVFVYQFDSYRYWQNYLGRSDCVFGQIGENFTVEGLSDTEVCIGDRYRIGGAVLEVTQPRVTCYRVGIRMREPRMAALLVEHGRPGFYFRVVEEGEVEAGVPIELLQRGPEGMRVSEVNDLLYKPGHASGDLERALRVPALSAGWRSSFEALLEKNRSGPAAAGNPGLVSGNGPPPGWVGFRPLKVLDKKRESESVTSLILGSSNGSPLAVGAPGQFILLRLRPKAETPALLRSYSLSGGPSDTQYRVSIRRKAGGTGSAYIQDEVQVGDVLDVAAPRGSFTLVPGTEPVVLLSAGVGATPVLAMLHALAAGASPREIWWIHGARDGSDHAFAAEVDGLVKKLPNSRRHVRYSAPGPADVPGNFDAAGRVSMSVLQELRVPRGADFYVCGPPTFMSELTTGLVSWGIAERRVHSEAFGARPALAPGIVGASFKPPHTPPGEAGKGVLISFARSGLSVRWGPPFESILDLAEACDVPVRWSCRTGVCHNCQTSLISGGVSYDPAPIEPPPEGSVLICCSKPKGDIVIDL